MLCNHDPHFLLAARPFSNAFISRCDQSSTRNLLLFLKMFAAEASVPGSLSIRKNPRRRQRNPSDEALAIKEISSKRRKRSSLGPDTFEPLSNGKANGVIHTPSIELPTHLNGGAPRPSRELSIESNALAVRSKPRKRAEREKRAYCVDGAVLVCISLLLYLRLLLRSFSRSKTTNSRCRTVQKHHPR